MAALGLDCSLHFVSDISGDARTQTLHLGFYGERAYRLLCAEGHVFMLTDKRLHAFPDLASRFLLGEPIDNSVGRRVDVEAIDVSLGPDRSLLIVRPDDIWLMPIDVIIGSAAQEDSHPPSVSVDPWENLDASPRQSLVEMELARVA
jgi:hypothetical protein